ncbi:glycosyltransferase involved in cell wall biosynthesis [Micromonospora sp. A202]|uniref:glycosyltransferase n=1 Tax=Micromonospora sp. A202 TaxID=2572899 RepID=UPI001151E578|nr:glycosyltransferase family 4 protein [Micromonospora sp. A202]TQJ21540.1 glycosyltransferase involved in cell wall biosynthesis [Micromonospora sp. A202]
MTTVLIVATAAPKQPAVLVEALERFRSKGATVTLACFFDSEELGIDPALAEIRTFAIPGEKRDARFRKALGRAPANRKIWLHARRSTWLRQQYRRADLLVALDARAVHTVWEMAQRNTRAGAYYGLVPAQKALAADRSESVGKRLERQVAAAAGIGARGARSAAEQTIRTTFQKATGQRVMSNPAGAWLWTRAVAAPRVPDRLRSKLAVRLHDSAVRAGRPAAGTRAASAAVHRINSLATRADMLTKAAKTELTLGHQPSGLHDAIRAQLALADDLLPRDTKKAAAAVSMAWSLSSNRVLHFDRLTSPMSTDPGAFVAPFRESTAARKLSQPRGRLTPAAPAPTDRPLRLLVTTLINDNFLSEILERYRAMPNVEVRFLDLYEDEVTRPLALSGSTVMEHLLAGDSSYGAKVEEWLRPHLDWADTIFVDWCQATAALFTLHDPGSTRIIVRLHSFEAFNFWPHLVDFSRVDDVVFVSDHLRDLSTAVLPQLTDTGGPRLWVIDNAMDLQRYPRSKPADARFNLGMVGFSSVAKDPRWTIEVLRKLRERDERYRLTLIGSNFNDRTSKPAKDYGKLLKQDLAELEPLGAVRRYGQTDDVPAALQEVGVIVSSSVRESFHCGLVEGAASGAVPVVRDWPFFAGKPHGARTLFPADWVVESPAEAAERIFAATATEEQWRETGQAAAEHALKTWDWSVTQSGFDRLLLDD